MTMRSSLNTEVESFSLQWFQITHLKKLKYKYLNIFRLIQSNVYWQFNNRTQIMFYNQILKNEHNGTLKFFIHHSQNYQ